MPARPEAIRFVDYDPDGPTYAGFITEAGAKAWRARMGGWVFVGDDARVIWFSHEITPEGIMVHPTTAGTGGRLK